MTRGFSLIELLVVLVLIGLSLTTMLAVGLVDEQENQQEQLRYFANELRLETAAAVLDGKILGLDFFTPDEDKNAALGWRWLSLDEGEWMPIEAGESGNEATAHYFFSTNVQLQIEGSLLELEAETASTLDVAIHLPEILLYPTREVTPFTLQMDDGDHLEVDLMGRVRVNEDAITAP